eukprot:2907595-Rhodomonas_salina.1
MTRAGGRGKCSAESNTRNRISVQVVPGMRVCVPDAVRGVHTQAEEADEHTRNCKPRTSLIRVLQSGCRFTYKERRWWARKVFCFGALSWQYGPTVPLPILLLSPLDPPLAVSPDLAP